MGWVCRSERLQGQAAARRGFCCCWISRIRCRPAASPPHRPTAVHLCFICVLHLANEHGLAIQGTPTLDHLAITQVPPMAAGSSDANR